MTGEPTVIDRARPVAASVGPRRIGAFNWRAVVTIMRHDLTMFFRWWMMSLGGPMLTIALFLLVFRLTIDLNDSTGDGRSVLSFLASGLFAMALMQRASENAAFTLMLAKIEGMVSDLLVPPVTGLEVIAANILASLVSVFVTAVPVGIVVALLADVVPERPLLFAVGILAACSLMAMLGLLAALWAERWDGLALAFGIIMMPIAFWSGVFVAPSSLPLALEVVVRALPFSYAIDALRAGLDGSADLPLTIALPVLAAFDIILFALLWVLWNRGWRLKS